MSLLSKIKSFLPASSRSLHAMYHELGQMHGQMGQMWAEVGQTRIMASEIRDRVERVQSEVSWADARAMLLLWELHRRDGEGIEDTKRRVLCGLSPATGNLRLYQLASAQLLFEFDAFCKRHGLRYWLQSGTLLGAVRHAGFIPWDDDLDVGMPRRDIERAIELVADDPRYVITVRYDYYVHCRQIRFRYADERVPSFVDLFIFDPVRRLGDETLAARESQRAALEADLDADESIREYWNEGAQFVDEGTDEAIQIKVHFDRHIGALYEAGVLTDSLDEAEGVVWAIDNVNSGVSHHSWYITPAERLFPLGEMPFEGHEVSVPKDSLYCLDAIFGDIYDLPEKIGSYFDHLLGGDLKDPKTREVLEGLVGGARDKDEES